MNISKKIRKNKSLFKILLFTGICTLSMGTQAFASEKSSYPNLPTMDSNWGFTYKPLQVPTRYWKYGQLDWTSNINHAKTQFSSSPANVSINVSDNHSYNDTKIRTSSNYWSDVHWSGKTNKLANNLYECLLNSSGNPSSDRRNKTATHEIAHAFGLNDCSNNKYLMYYNSSGGSRSITTYENNLFLNRYGKY